MCTEMTKTYDDILGLCQLLYICEAEQDALKWQGWNWLVGAGGGGGGVEVGMCLTQ